MVEGKVTGTAPAGTWRDQGLQVVVLFTTASATLGALRAAVRLADGLGARIRVVVPYVVPYPLAVERPLVDLTVISRDVCTLAQEAGVECSIDVRLCRDRGEALREAIPERSLVMTGRRPRWWEFEERRLAARLRRAGHQVVYAAEEIAMIDLVYVAIALLFFAGTWRLVKACETL